jgi:hypothetical protein
MSPVACRRPGRTSRQLTAARMNRVVTDAPIRRNRAFRDTVGPLAADRANANVRLPRVPRRGGVDFSYATPRVDL